MLACMLSACSGLYAQHLKAGDLLFETIPCGPLCDAINKVTPAYKGRHFNHVGMLITTPRGLRVIEAIGSGVGTTSLDSFQQRTRMPIFIGRLKKPYRCLIEKAQAFSIQQIGKPYNISFIMNSDSYYCSQLIYDAFYDTSQGKSIFHLYPMEYKAPGSIHYFPNWESYFKKLHIQVPEGLPGCNPGGLMHEKAIKIIGKLNAIKAEN